MRSHIAALAAATLLTLSTASCAIPEEEDGTAADRADVNSQTADNKSKASAKGKKSESAPEETAGQENARKSAEGYLDLSAFSRDGLIKQLKFEGFSPKDAAYGVDAQKADWNKQAAASAENYLDLSSFSREGLIKQLEFEGFTPKQAEFGVSKTGL